MPRPNELMNIDKMMQDRAQAQAASRAAPQVYKVSQKYYALAEEAYDEGEAEDCIYYSTIAAIKFTTALEHAKRLAAEDRRTKAEQRLEVANQQRAKLDQTRADLNRRIGRMEKILALQATLEAEKKQSQAEKKRVAAELEEAKKQAKAKLEAEKKAAAEKLAAEKAQLEEVRQEKEVQELLAQASSKIQTAEALEAKSYDPMNLNSAKTFMAQAKQALTQKRYQNAKDLAKMSDEKISLAIAKAKAEYAKKKKEADVRKERENLFNDANAISGTEVKQEKRGVILTLHEMFEPKKTEVLPEQNFLLDKIAQLAKKYPEYPIVVEGYTDSRGRESNNLALSQGRAQSVLNYLVQEQSLGFNRIKAAGYGESRPVADNSSAQGRAKNRRVEVIFLFR
jgi:outer membrane protein OmpA-like peptidoglycan-associated protein